MAVPWPPSWWRSPGKAKGPSAAKKLMDRGDPDRREAAGWIDEPKSRLQRDHLDLVDPATCVHTAEWSYVRRSNQSDEPYDRGIAPYKTST